MCWAFKMGMRRNTREEAGFKESKEKSTHDKASVALSKSHAYGNDP